MSNIHELPEQDRRYDDASIWIAKMDKGLSADEKNALTDWLSESNGNRDVFLNMVKQWDKMDSLSRLSGIFPHTVIQQRRPSRLSLALAASLVTAVFAGLWGIAELRQAADPENAVPASTAYLYETAVGEQSAIVLPDGTEILLNTNSLVRATYTDERRLLTLERGELNVKVAHDPSWPLSVIANGRVIQAVGTEFNLEITSDQWIELVVTEGTVRAGVFESEDHPGDATTPAILSASSVSVSAGEEIVLGSPEEELRTIKSEDIEIKLSWRDGDLIFLGESLEEAVAEIGRYTVVEFVFLDEEAKRIRVSGLFKVGDVNGLLSTLRKNFNITYERVSDDRILLSSR